MMDTLDKRHLEQVCKFLANLRASGWRRNGASLQTDKNPNSSDSGSAEWGEDMQREHNATKEYQIGELTNRLDQAFTEQKEMWPNEKGRYKSEAE